MSNADEVVAQRNKMVLDHYPMVRAMAGRLYHRLPDTVEVDDLVSVGVTGLIEAIDRYDPSRGVAFAVFARHRVNGSMMDALRATDWVPRSVRRKNVFIAKTRAALDEQLGRPACVQEMAERCQLTVKKYKAMVDDSHIAPLLSLDTPVSGAMNIRLRERIPSKNEDPVESMHYERLCHHVEQVMSGLPKRERAALALHYLRELTLKEVGRVLEVSESRACQLCGQGIRRMRPRLRRYAAA